ncbi:Arm DNA-binding domain-containing protein [Larkinella sp. C7]|jgi:integrase/recombinase XerD|uniref:Arm DNA-binding domain-containing protein n=1 Tax=Larkinella sp. C7 TaxID=2576607 RepID=UPI0011112E4E|nr:Arm DNA-binding domain-containing protein [Larkinella sp. C7]
MGNVQDFFKKVIIKDDYVKTDGTSALYIYVAINGSKVRIPLKLAWPPNYFDKAAGKLLPRSKDDKDYADLNMMIET